MAFCFFGAITASLLLDRFGKRLPMAALWAIALWTSYDLMHTGANRPMNAYEGGYKEQTSEYRIARTTDLVDRLRQLVTVCRPLAGNLQDQHLDGAYQEFRIHTSTSYASLSNT